MIAVVLGPFRSADLLVVLYRNGQMILRLAQLYQTRPAPVEQLRIVRDVLAVVATVNLLNFTEKFVEQLFERVPVLGQLAGDVTQGVGAGLLTSATGHAAMNRARVSTRGVETGPGQARASHVWFRTRRAGDPQSGYFPKLRHGFPTSSRSPIVFPQRLMRRWKGWATGSGAQ